MSLKTVQDLLTKHRLVEDMVNRQVMPRHDLVETMVQKQHLVELRLLLARLESAEIAEILDGLSPEDLFLVWGQIDDERVDDILDEVSDVTRDTLASRSSYLGSACVVNAFELAQGRLSQITIESADDLEGIKPIWVDLVGTTKADRRKIGQYFGLELPDPEDLTDLNPVPVSTWKRTAKSISTRTFCLTGRGTPATSRWRLSCFTTSSFRCEVKSYGLPPAATARAYPGRICFRWYGHAAGPVCCRCGVFC